MFRMIAASLTASVFLVGTSPAFSEDYTGELGKH